VVMCMRASCFRTFTEALCPGGRRHAAQGRR
jgi:hypothetical protein